MGAAADPVKTLSAILAGAGPAQDALLLVLMGPVDELARSHTLTAFVLYVDDLGAHTRGGSEKEIVDQSERVVDHMTDLIEGGDFD